VRAHEVDAANLQPPPPRASPAGDRALPIVDGSKEAAMNDREPEPDPHIHRAEEADEPQSIERVPRATIRSGEIDQAGGQAGLHQVDNDLSVGDIESGGNQDTNRH